MKQCFPNFNHQTNSTIGTERSSFESRGMEIHSTIPKTTEEEKEIRIKNEKDKSLWWFKSLIYNKQKIRFSSIYLSKFKIKICKYY